MSLFYSTHSNPIYTTNELKQAVYKSTCGVLPIRRSTSIPELNVHLRGRTLMSSNDMRVAANTPISPNAALVIDVDSTTTASYFPPPPVQSPVELDRLLLQKRRQPLPAILPVTGTTHTATLLHRQPPVKPVIYIPPVKRKRLKILEIDVGAENDEAQIVTDRSALEEQQDAVSTVAKMLNEAKALRADNSKRTTPATPLNLSRTSRKSVKASSTTPTHALYGATKTDDPTLTAVENLISSIKSKELQEAQRQSDNRILEIIDRVLGRKVELKYDDDLTEEQQQKEIPKEALMSGITLSEAPSPVLESGGPDVSRADYAATFEEKFRNEDIDQELADVDEESSVETEAPELSIDIEHDALYKHYLIGITNEELLHIRGNKIPFLVKQEFMKETKSPRETTLKTSTSERGIHHFCIQMMDSSLPFSLQTITQLYHKRARFRHHLPKSNIYYKHGNLPKYSLTNDSKTDDQFEQEHDAPRHSAISHTTQRSIPSIPYNSLPTTSEENELDTWQKRADILFKVPEIEGTSVVQLGENARLWTPAPPKMYFHPSKVKQKLFPKYKTSISIMKIANDDDAKHDDELDETIDTNWSEKDDVDELVMRNERLLSRKYKSLEILPSQITSLMNNLNEPLNQIVDHVHLSRSRSCPDISVLHTETIKFETDYLFTLAETKHQMINMAESLAKATAPIVKPIGTPTQAAMMSDQIDEPITHSSFVDFSVPGISSSSQIDTSSSPVDETSKEVKNNNQEFKYFRKNQRSFLYEQAIAAGRPYITSAKLRSQRQKKKEVKYWKRIDDIVKLATDSGKIPERRYSINETRTIVRKHKKRQSSLDRQKQQFDQIKRTYNYETTRIKSGGKRQLTEFQWTRDIWYQWLDEYIAELDKREQDRQVKEDEQIITDSEPVYQYDVNDDDDDETETKKKRLQVISEPIVNITISIDDEDSEQEKVIIENELKRLNILIEQNLRDVYSLTRRGALYRKLGLFKDALNDLNLALYIEPLFMDAYWQKSLILMIFKHYDDALDCLNHVIKLNKTHSGAYKLRGDIYLVKNDLSLAIANYSQAIKYNPNDHESFYQRAQTYERRNDLLLAMDDYVQVTRLNPDNIEAWSVLVHCLMVTISSDILKLSSHET
ncbi:unnamed protein product [Didymodactylos carnosus]|uniref:Uncharacterized protein n=1 Tax=Didymodactylos carnosus TaxID=1234261 RepID=A0A8S2EQA8_9BILA|nr:unnamed protein product [Didymodactylos carnosus]CAF4019405.1 unnamed protein product [Didymodactylos carnosus]